MKEVKKRILWVDIAKALAILSVPISHTLNLDMTIRGMIFSFHMPLFFILSGYTTKLAEDKKTLIARTKKNFKYLILPALAVVLFYFVCTAINVPGDESLITKIWHIFRETPVGYYPFSTQDAVITWFLFALFEAKFMMDVVNILFKTEKNGLIFFFFGVLGVALGIFGHHQRFSFDLALVATMFIEVGILWRRYEAVIKKYTLPLLLVACAYWFSHTLRGDYVEFWARYYGGYEGGILTAFAGVFIVSNFAMMLEEAAKKAGKFFNFGLNSLVTLGKNTMLFYLIHSLDFIVLRDFWDVREGTPPTGKSILISCVLRLLLDTAFFLIIYHGLKLIKNRKKA